MHTISYMHPRHEIQHNTDTYYMTMMFAARTHTRVQEGAVLRIAKGWSRDKTSEECVVEDVQSNTM